MDVLLPKARVGWMSFLELVCSVWFPVLDLGLHLGTSYLHLLCGELRAVEYLGLRGRVHALAQGCVCKSGVLDVCIACRLTALGSG